MSFNAGDRLEARCTRCKDIMGHVIVSMMGSEIAKVECCACKSVHKYYPPEKKKEGKKESTLRVRAGEKRSNAVKEKVVKTLPSVGEKKTESSSVKKANKNSLEVKENWEKAMVSNASTPIPYNMHIEVRMDTVVDHTVFGIGVVVEVFPPDKANFLFAEGIKSLRCNCK